MSRQLRFSRTSNVALAQNGAHQFAARHALCHYASNSIFTFIPKNACSTLRLSLAIGNGCIPNASGHAWIHSNNSTFSASLRDLATANFTAVILRDPFTRLSSVYLDKIVNRDREFWNFNDLTGRRFDPDEVTFRVFVEEVTTPQLLRSEIHWRPQVDFLVYDDYDLWGCLEQFSEAKDEIEERSGMTVADARPLTKHATTDRFEIIDVGFFADTPPSEIRRMNAEGKIPSHRSLYAHSLRKRVSEAYAKDIEIYRHRFPERPIAWALEA